MRGFSIIIRLTVSRIKPDGLNAYILTELGIPIEGIKMPIDPKSGEEFNTVGDIGENNTLVALRRVSPNVTAYISPHNSSEDMDGVDITAIFPDLKIDGIDIQVKTNIRKCIKHLHFLCEELIYPYDEKLPIRMAQEGKMLVRGNSVECAANCIQKQLVSIRRFWSE